LAFVPTSARQHDGDDGQPDDAAACWLLLLLLCVSVSVTAVDDDLGEMLCEVGEKKLRRLHFGRFCEPDEGMALLWCVEFDFDTAQKGIGLLSDITCCCPRNTGVNATTLGLARCDSRMVSRYVLQVGALLLWSVWSRESKLVSYLQSFQRNNVANHRGWTVVMIHVVSESTVGESGSQ
jgi:hypothetical protein